jgi:hypothetical protein
MKIGIGALFFSYGKLLKKVRLSVYLTRLFHTMQLVIMLIMGVISIPMLAKARNEAVKSKVFQNSLMKII